MIHEGVRNGQGRSHSLAFYLHLRDHRSPTCEDLVLNRAPEDPFSESPLSAKTPQVTTLTVTSA